MSPADSEPGAAHVESASAPAGRRLLAVHAHPDDETIANGATLAKYVDSGAHVTLVTCTLGEEGEILVPELEHLAAAESDRLGSHRIGELAAAMRELGVSDHRFLGGPGRWRDSGMMGTPSNDRPDSFWRADLLEAAAELVPVIREVRPQVLLTYDTFGGYGHPDHIQAHRVATYASDLAAVAAFRPELGPAWNISKVYWSTLPRSVIQNGIDALIASGQSGFFGTDNAEEFPMAIDDSLVTTRIRATEFEPRKMRALAAHASQVTADGPFFEMARVLGPGAMGIEFYALARGRVGPASVDADGFESDLFDGIASD
jgi:N-acetyl-1-D-myo-inositol-2-amino-2-deoxy-alpha-D-glucopyranoside deacetylase